MKVFTRERFKKIIFVVVCFAILIGLIYSQMCTYAASTRTGVVTCSSDGTVNTRESASTSAAIVNKLANGKPLIILDETTGTDGYIWYHVSYILDANGEERTAYIRSDYVTITSSGDTSGTTEVSGDYADQLRNAGFPESYITKLAALHAKYPSWTFEAVNTGLDWKTVISKESANGWNLVPTSEDDSRKSVAAGAYDWTTNTWTIYDGSTWVSANPDYIAYCMDPRNFLDETNIFQFEKLSYSSSQSLSGVQSILQGTFMSGSMKEADGSTADYAQTFMDIGKATGVSPYHLAARVLQEQGAGTSAMISGTYSSYVGYYNYFNYGAFGTTSALVIENGLAYAKAQGWNTRYKSLLGGASLLAKNYINVGQDTLYFQKFNVVNTSNLYSHQYMANVTAAITEGQKTAKGYADKNQAFVFRIPIYNNMPSGAVQFTATGNPNNYLKSLSVSGLSLTPTFSGATTSYSIVVSNSVSSISVSAAAVAATSTVSGTGTYQLSVGNNTIKVNCKSQSGDIKTYTITVARQAASSGSSGSTDTSYSISSSRYTIGSAITGVSPGTSAADFLKSVTAKNCTLKLLDASGKENSKTVGTGNKLALYVNGSLKATYSVIIYGDVNGDGAIDVLDMIKLNRHILGLSKLTGDYLKAADANRKNDGADVLDMITVNRHVLGLSAIRQ